MISLVTKRQTRPSAIAHVRKELSDRPKPVPTASTVSALSERLAEVQKRLAPLWPLADFVAVNPLLGMTDAHFLEARNQLRSVRDADLLMPLSYYQHAYREGYFDLEELSEALAECRASGSSLFADLTLAELTELLEVSEPTPDAEQNHDRCYWTVAELYDRQQRTTWTTHVVNEVSKTCAAHYDQGQALWPSPWQGLPLYEAWRSMAVHDRRMEKLGLPGFRTFVGQLPASPLEAIEHCLQLIGVPEAHREQFLPLSVFLGSGLVPLMSSRLSSKQRSVAKSMRI